jgi:hypothetical protein
MVMRTRARGSVYVPRGWQKRKDRNALHLPWRVRVAFQPTNGIACRACDGTTLSISITDEILGSPITLLFIVCK